MAQMHFYLLLRSFVSFLVFNAFITSTLGKLLPRVRTGSQSPIIYSVGAKVRIECPIYDDENPDFLFFDWFDEKGQPIRESSRIKINERVLIIKSAIKDDSGLYTCKGINGFGTETTSLTLQIVREEDLQALSSPLDNQYPFQYPQNDNLVLETDVNSEFIHKKTESQPTVRTSEPKVIEKPVGVLVTMSCNTKARTKWSKNGRPLSLDNLPYGSSKRRGVLNISKVRIEDSGNYSCVTHGWPQVNNTFTLIVYDKPELTAFHPINTSVVLGERAVFHCKVRSEVKPIIQWLGSYKDVKDVEDARRQGLIQINSQFYKVLKSTKMIETGDGNYYKDLIIENTNLNDSANYICLAAYTNPVSFNLSFTYKSTYLTVLPPHKPTDNTWLKSNETSTGLSISTIFWISCAVVSLIVAILIGILNQLQKKYENRVNSAVNNNIGRDNIADKPRDYSNHYYFRPELSSAQSGYMSGMGINTNVDNCSSDRLTYQT